MTSDELMVIVRRHEANDTFALMLLDVWLESTIDCLELLFMGLRHCYSDPTAANNRDLFEYSQDHAVLIPAKEFCDVSDFLCEEPTHQ